jgi:hypothetical protein
MAALSSGLRSTWRISLDPRLFSLGEGTHDDEHARKHEQPRPLALRQRGRLMS